MKCSAIAFASCAMAFGQSSPNYFELPKSLVNPSPSSLQQRLKSMKLMTGPQPLRVMSVEKPGACAIPLLNALPAHSNAEYKIRIFKPLATVDKGAILPIGVPACK